MAKTSFSQRFPAFKWVVLTASLLTLVLTVFSVQYVSTNTQQHAATTYTCSSSNTSGTCPTGQGCAYDSSLSMYTCVYKVSAPTGLNTDAKICKASGTEYDFFDFNWNSVSHATSYTVYYKIYGTSTYSHKNTTDNHLVVTSYKNLNGRRIQWYVKASNAYFSNSSAVYYTSAPKTDCYWMTTP